MPDKDTSSAADGATPATQLTPQQSAQQQPAPGASEPQTKTASTSGADAAGAPRPERNAQLAVEPVASVQPKTEGEPSLSAEAKPAAAASEPQQAPDGTPQQDAASARRPSVGSRPSAARKATRQPTKRKKVRRWPRIVALVLLIAVVSVVSLAAWQYWLRFDDAADVQGTWVMQGTTEQVSITSTDIVLSPDVSYDYSIDTWSKNLTYTFGNLAGSGSYHFADNRNTIVIREQGTIDIGIALGLEDDPALLAADNIQNGIIVLNRVS